MNANAAMNIMMGWMKWMASWVLSLFNLTGAGGFSPLSWLSDNWIKLLVFFLITGVAADILVWLLRWRPYWVWFNKKRIVIHDDNFFAGEELVDSGLYDPSLFFDPELTAAQKRRSARPAPSTIVKPERRRPVLLERADNSAFARPARREERRPAPARTRPEPRRAASAAKPKREPGDGLFHVDPASEINPETGEDAVFNVSDLPVSRDELEFRHKRH